MAMSKVCQIEVVQEVEKGMKVNRISQLKATGPNEGGKGSKRCKKATVDYRNAMQLWTASFQKAMGVTARMHNETARRRIQATDL